MGIKGTIVDWVVNCVMTMFPLRRANILSCHLAQTLNPVYTACKDGKRYLFFCPNDITRWRLDTYFIKEPETIGWIDTFKSGDIMFDIGANIGLYSIYAALRGVTVVAFEPESQNYALLNRNVFLNQAQDRVTCLNVALSDTDGLVYLYIPVFEAGRALNNFESACVESAGSGKPEFKQGVIAFSLDSYLSRYPRVFPTHIKIDVDGAESKIVKGAAKTLQDERLLSVSLEIDESLPEHEELAPFIVSKGFTLTQKKHADMFDGTKYGKTYNYLFIRK